MNHFDIITGEHPTAEKIAAIRERNGEALAENAREAAAHGTTVEDEAWGEDVEIRELLAAIDHVTEVLREAQRNNGGYGFLRDLLEYLGATEEVPA